MILKARPEGSLIVLDLEGHLDFETTSQLKHLCSELMKQNKSERLVFNLEKLKFVGSCGIHQFIRVLKDFNSFEEKPKYFNVSSEFEKMFRAFQNSRAPFEIFESKEVAISQFPSTPPKLPAEVDIDTKPVRKNKKRAPAATN